MFPKSIRWRVQLWHGMLLMLIVLALVMAFYSYVRQARLQEVDIVLHRAMIPLLPRLGPIGRPGPSLHRPPPPQLNGDDFLPPAVPQRPFPVHDNSHAYHVIWSPDGKILTRSPNAPEPIPFPSPSGPGPASEIRMRGEVRELFHRGPRGDIALVGTSILEVEQELRRLMLWLGLCGTGVVALGLVGGWWITGKTLRPIQEIEGTVAKIAEGDLGQRIPIHEAESEIGHLAVNLNKTFERLEVAFDQQTQFTADASHELRTPLTVMLTQIQLALARERSGEFYRETLQTCERAAERMRVLVNSLLELARVEAGEYQLMREDSDLGKIARDAVEFIQPLAQTKNATLHTDFQPVSAPVDPAKLSQVLINLLSNAIHHNDPGIQVSIDVAKSDRGAIICVRDSGKGIPPEALGRIFDRFYRLEKSRVRLAEKQGTGLGLSICKAIVEAHGGTIAAESAPGKGSQFTIRLPLR